MLLLNPSPGYEDCHAYLVYAILHTWLVRRRYTVSKIVRQLLLDYGMTLVFIEKDRDNYEESVRSGKL